MINLIVAAAFALFLAAPLMTLAVAGYSTLSERPQRWKDIDLAALLASDDDYRKGLLKKVMTDSPAGMMAVRAKSTFEYDIFGYVETDQVISGDDGWLYYKPQFFDGTCLDLELIAQGLDLVEALTAVASGAGIRFAFSVSPDKSVAQSEHLGTRARAASGCKLPTAEAWRRMAAANGSHIIDHLAEFRATDLPPGTELYLKTDTHWNEYAQAIAARGWSERWLGIDPGLPETSDGQLIAIRTDLGTNMLRLDRMELTTSFESFWQGRFQDTVGTGIRNAVILHDSFYARARPSLQVLFRDAEFFDRNHPDEKGLRAAIAARPHYLLVNSVERRVFARLRNGEYGWEGALGLGLLDANEAAGESCVFESVNRASGTTENLIELPDTLSRLPCLRISMPAASGEVWVLLPSSTSPIYRTSFSIVRSNDGREAQDWKLVLPLEYAGTTVLVRTELSEDMGVGIKVGQAPNS
ncbi:MAG: alginate O-acetyltransferase AlgX-related protein [Methyloligella sp. ZOD6]